MSIKPAVRKAKNRRLTLTDEAWEELGRRAGGPGLRSAAVEAWLTPKAEEPTEPETLQPNVETDPQ